MPEPSHARSCRTERSPAPDPSPRFNAAIPHHDSAPRFRTRSSPLVRLLTGMLCVTLALAVTPAFAAATPARGLSAPMARTIARVHATSPLPTPRRQPSPGRHVPRAHAARPVRLARREASGSASLRFAGSSAAVRVSPHTHRDHAARRLPAPRHPQRRHRAVSAHAGRGPPGPRPRPQPRHPLLKPRAPRISTGAPRRAHRLRSRARPRSARVPVRMAAPESSDARPPPARAHLWPAVI